MTQQELDFGLMTTTMVRTPDGLMFDSAEAARAHMVALASEDEINAYLAQSSHNPRAYTRASRTIKSWLAWKANGSPGLAEAKAAKEAEEAQKANDEGGS